MSVNYSVEKSEQKFLRPPTAKPSKLDLMTNEQVLNDLKQKRLPTFGTAGERRDRLKKHLGLDSSD